MSKTLENIFKEAADVLVNSAKYEPAAITNGNLMAAGMFVAAGMEFMYKVLGWRCVEDELPPFGEKVEVLGEQISMNPNMGGAYHVITFRQDLKGTQLENTAGRHQCAYQFKGMNYTKFWKPLTPKPYDITTLEKLIQEQLKKGGKE